MGKEARRPLVVLALAVGLVAPGSLWALCDTDADKQAVAETRAIADERCDCDAATSVGSYKTCVRTVVTEQLLANRLPLACKAVVMRCAGRSVCGRRSGQAVTCCKIDFRGVRTCRVKSLPSQCHSTAAATACVSTAKSCCDACESGFGCTASTTTTTTTSTTTTTL